MAKQADSVVLSVRVSVEKAAALDRLAMSTERNRQWLLEQAVDRYLLDQAWQIEAIQEGLAAAEDGDTVAHADVRAWLLSWGRKDEREPPA